MRRSVTERFFNYVKIDTTSSDENSITTPSTTGQMELAELLEVELRSIGVKKITLTDNGYLYAKIDRNCDLKDSVGFIAHLDTSPAVSGKNVAPLRFRYEGGDVKDSDGKTIIKESKELLKYVGEEIITTDGRTLLGADDKAGIAEIVTACDFIIKNSATIKHRDIYIAFVPDEEIGHQLKYFDKKLFNCKSAFTIDGGEEGEVEYGCFNAYRCSITFHGRNIHPGYANGRLVSATEIISYITSSIFSMQISPNESTGDDGFIHITSVNSTEEFGELKLIIRDFTDDGIKLKMAAIDEIVERTKMLFKDKYKDYPISIEHSYTLQYKNMEGEISKYPKLLDEICKAVAKNGIKPVLKRIRGGTDGAALTMMGIICPNIFTGGHNFHSTSEWISVKSMENAVKTIINLSVIE